VTAMTSSTPTKRNGGIMLTLSCRMRNVEYVDVYADEAVTGTSIEKRDDFNRMMADCRRGKSTGLSRSRRAGSPEMLWTPLHLSVN
jgi:hypothetical protein